MNTPSLKPLTAALCAASLWSLPFAARSQTAAPKPAEQAASRFTSRRQLELLAQGLVERQDLRPFRRLLRDPLDAEPGDERHGDQRRRQQPTTTQVPNRCGTHLERLRGRDSRRNSRTSRPSVCSIVQPCRPIASRRSCLSASLRCRAANLNSRGVRRMSRLIHQASHVLAQEEEKDFNADLWFESACPDISAVPLRR